MWVHLHNCKSQLDERSGENGRAHWPSPEIQGMSESTWPGYLRSDGRKGIRNIVLVIYTMRSAQLRRTRNWTR